MWNILLCTYIYIDDSTHVFLRKYQKHMDRTKPLQSTLNTTVDG